MKKLTVILLPFIVIGTICIYIFIPTDLAISEAQVLPFPVKMANRSFNDTAIRKKWWPENNVVGDKGVLSTRISNKFLKPDEIYFQYIPIGKGPGTLNSSFNITELNRDSAVLNWNCTINCSFSPIDRIWKYLRAVRIKKAMNKIIDSFVDFTMHESDVYGTAINKIHVEDSLLISTKKIFENYPRVASIYEMVRSLQDYLISQNATQTNPPMLNIIEVDRLHYQAMVAIPISRPIPENEDNKIKRMLYGGFLLTTEVKGGVAEVNNAMKQLDHYRKDHDMLSPAIPYQSLITDRSEVSDSSKWITRVFYPVY
jgi:hypothetical protein